MPLNVKLKVEFELSDLWISKEEFKELSRQQLEELLQEDLLSFVEEIPGGITEHCEFSWKEPPPPPTSADICRKHGWDVGALLVGDEGHGPEIIKILGIGEESIFAKTISINGEEPTRNSETIWDLRFRDWKLYTE